MIPILKLFLFIFYLFLLSCCSLYDCSNDIYPRLDNNAGKYKLVKFSRDCGATTDFSTQISVLPIAEKLPDDESGNIFVPLRSTPRRGSRKDLYNLFTQSALHYPA